MAKIIVYYNIVGSYETDSDYYDEEHTLEEIIEIEKESCLNERDWDIETFPESIKHHVSMTAVWRENCENSN